MQVLVRHDDHISGNGLEQRVTAMVEASLDRYRDQITRVEVHLADENGPKSGNDDFRCTLEVHVGGRPPLAVTQKGTSAEVVIGDAADKMLRMLDDDLGKLRDPRAAG
ncbi:MAG TPA: HPF/RaiA family ribosome-associated protein [Kofleriaceae bacterium]|nr:HPF/RaiA family ribosome-associated protein [Kofleriaceae bacterium]